MFTPISLTILLALSVSAQAADFTIVNGQVETNSQTLNDNEMGAIEVGGQLNTANNTAIIANGINTIVNNAGNISTTGNGAFAIFSDGDNVSITNSGSISTTGDGSISVFLDGNNASITNSGSISTTGDGAIAIFSDLTNASITNSGLITTTNNFARGIESNGTNANISNSGSISTAGSNARGIESTGTNANISNSGIISTTGIGSHGIDLTNADATLFNSGTISTTAGSNAVGIVSRDANAIINLTNTSTITTTGSFAYGVFSFGADATINNSGSISTAGSNAHGINSTGINTNISNSGSISTAGTNARGIESTGTNANINNSGIVSTTGAGAHGIDLTGADATLNNSGAISTAGSNAIGIVSRDANATLSLTNTSAITTTGASSHGVFLLGASPTINNSGIISATGAGAFAILGVSNDITLNILPGSHIIGRINLGDNGGDNDTANVFTGGISSYLTFENTENINLFGAGVVIGNDVITVDPSGTSALSTGLSHFTDAVHNMVNQQLAHVTPFKPVQVASLELAPGMLFQPQGPVAWSQVLGGRLDRKAQGSSVGYDNDQVGIAFGYEWDVNQYRIGLLGGAAFADTDANNHSFETNTDSYFLGAYGQYNFDAFKVTISAIGGYNEYDHQRAVIDNINGAEVAKSDFDAVFLSPSITVSTAYTVNEYWEFRPSATLNYSVAWLEGYTERGTTNSNLKVDDRTLQTWAARVQLALAYKLNEHNELALRAGLDARHNNNDRSNASIAGNAFSFSEVGEQNISGGFIGARLQVAAFDSLTVSADVEYAKGSDEKSVRGFIRIAAPF